MKMSSTSTTRILIMIIVKLLFTFICFDLIVLTASTTNKSPLSATLSSPSSSPSKISSSLSRAPGLSSGSASSVRCPLPHLIKPCDCIEIEKGVDSEFKDSELTDSTNETDTLDDEIPSDETSSNINRQPHPDTIETVVFCKHIYSRKQLMESMKAFSGHRINYLVIDSCSIPPFPTNIFDKIHIMWMEVLNSTIQFRESFFECGANCL